MLIPGCKWCLRHGGGDRKLAALIERVDGPAYWRLNDTSKPTQLDPERDEIRKLYEGESVSCGRNGHLRLRLSNGLTKDLSETDRWYKVKYSPPQPSSVSEKDAAKQEAGRRAVAALAGSAGTPRGGSVFISPAEGGAIRPGDLVLRWNPGILAGSFSLSILGGDGNPIWKQDNIAATPCLLVSISAREALRNYRDAGGEEDLTMLVRAPGRKPERMHFSLLSKDEEESLGREIAFWDQQPPSILRHIGRAGTFTERRLFWEAAEEYNAAIAEAPKSHDLIVVGLEANRRAGNSARVDELTGRLAALR